MEEDIPHLADRAHRSLLGTQTMAGSERRERRDKEWDRAHRLRDMSERPEHQSRELEDRSEGLDFPGLAPGKTAGPADPPERPKGTRAEKPVWTLHRYPA
jgi:hypothetical protein